MQTENIYWLEQVLSCPPTITETLLSSPVWSQMKKPIKMGLCVHNFSHWDDVKEKYKDCSNAVLLLCYDLIPSNAYFIFLCDWQAYPCWYPYLLCVSIFSFLCHFYSIGQGYLYKLLLNDMLSFCPLLVPALFDQNAFSRLVDSVGILNCNRSVSTESTLRF